MKEAAARTRKIEAVEADRSVGEASPACAECIEDAYSHTQTEFLAALQRVVDGDHGEAHRALNETMLRLRWLNERRLPSAASMSDAQRLEKLGGEALRFAWTMRFRLRPMFLATEIWQAVRCYFRAIIARTIAAAWWLLDGR
jgi:hypothetical protein